MQPKYNKITILLLFIALMHGLEACLDCGCPAFLGHYNFKALKLETPALKPGEDFYMLLQADSVTYVADAAARPSFGWNNAAWACSCAENGDFGPISPIKSINIYADQDFNDTLPAGKSLNNLFKIKSLGSDYGPTLSVFNAQDPEQTRWEVFRIDQAPAQLQLTDEPTHPGQPYLFRVVVKNTFGDTFSVVSDTIRF